MQARRAMPSLPQVTRPTERRPWSRAPRDKAGSAPTRSACAQDTETPCASVARSLIMGRSYPLIVNEAARGKSCCELCLEHGVGGGGDRGDCHCGKGAGGSAFHWPPITLSYPAAGKRVLRREGPSWVGDPQAWHEAGSLPGWQRLQSHRPK